MWAPLPPPVQSGAPNQVETRTAPVFSEAVQVRNGAVTLAPKSESSDSVDLKIKVTYANPNESLVGIFIFPFDPNGTIYVLNSKQAEYTYRTPKGEYEIIYWGNKEDSKGQTFYYIEKFNAQKDTSFSINTADISIETPILNVTPTGEPFQQDFIISSTKEIAVKGNAHDPTYVQFAIEYARTGLHLTHATYMLRNQKLKWDSAESTILNTQKSPYIWVNRKDVPFNIFQLYRYCGPEGTMGVRQDIHPGEYGDTIRNTKESWDKLELKFADNIKGTPTATYNPDIYLGNGTVFWHDGMQYNSTLGYIPGVAGDKTNCFWLSAKPNGTLKGYDFMFLPAKALSRIGTSSTEYGYGVTPITATKEGIGFMPIQYLYPGLKIWAGCDGYGVHINDCVNSRITPTKDMVWGEGLAFASFYPNYNNKAATPQYSIGIKGMYAEQRAQDTGISEIAIDTLSNGKWNTLWTSTSDKVTSLSSTLKTAKYSGKVGFQMIDTCYFIGSTRGKSISRMEFDMKNTADFTAPSINMLNIRDKNDKIVANVEYLNEATIEMYAADLEGWMKNYFGFKMHEVKTATARFRMNGTEKWINVPLKENQEYYEKIFWGQNYSGSLKDVVKEGKAGLYDIEVTAEDPAGNKCTVTAMPAFAVEKDGVANGLTEIAGDHAFTPVLEGGIISCPGYEAALIEIYDVAGMEMARGRGSIDVSSLPAGLVIVKVSADNAQTVRKFRLF